MPANTHKCTHTRTQLFPICRALPVVPWLRWLLQTLHTRTHDPMRSAALDLLSLLHHCSLISLPEVQAASALIFQLCNCCLFLHPHVLRLMRDHAQLQVKGPRAGKETWSEIYTESSNGTIIIKLSFFIWNNFVCVETFHMSIFQI